MKNNIDQLLHLLSDLGLVKNTMPSVDELINNIVNKNVIRIVYGETYDIYGQTVDSLKYYFFIELLQRHLEEFGIVVESFVIIGDAHSVKNKIVKNKEELLSIAEKRLTTIKNIKNIYHLRFEPLLMTDLLKTEKFANNLRQVKQLFEESEEFQHIAKNTVLQNRISQEEKSGFQYVLEEVALIIDYDIKIGPPRENNYDKLACSMGKSINDSQLNGVYLKPTYPLGKKFDYFVTHPEIEEFGVTPYKAGSNKLQDNRIIIGVTADEKTYELIDESFLPKNLSLPNPIFDLYLISQMAISFMNNQQFNVDQKLLNSPDIFKENTYKNLLENVIKPLRG